MVESRIFTIVTALLERLSEELHTLLQVFNSTRDEANNATHPIDPPNIATAATRAIAPGGLASVLLTAAFLVRLLHCTLVRARAARLTDTVPTLANSEDNGEASHPKND